MMSGEVDSQGNPAGTEYMFSICLTWDDQGKALDALTRAQGRLNKHDREALGRLHAALYDASGGAYPVKSSE